MLLLGCPVPYVPVIDTGDPPVVCEGDDETGATILVQPYVQHVLDGSAWILWETDVGVGSRVEWVQAGRQHVACGERVPMAEGLDPDDADTQVHAVQLTLLSPGVPVAYRALTGDAVSDEHTFQPPADEGPVRFAAFSDSQRDDGHPEVFAEVVQGVVDVATADGPELYEALDFVLVPGDLVDNGWLPEEWQEQYFAPAADLFGAVPSYPVPGNHEGGSPWFFRYFHLPASDLGEHAWRFDQANVRVIGLDSNGWNEDGQLAWLETELDEACRRRDLDFVFLQIHHPWLSELWTPGESAFTGEVVAQLEAFTTACEKPSTLLFGHTHGYSRGESRDHQHLMVNVAAAGGALDRWGTQDSADYPEFGVSQDTYGFVLVEVAQDPASVTLSRYSLGTPEARLHNELSDEVTIWLENTPPDRPGAPEMSCAPGPTVTASAFSDADGHAHHGTHWQAATSCAWDGDLLVDTWRQERNEFFGADTQADDDLTDEPIDLAAGTGICWRVRYRDEGLAWSDWSSGHEETVPACTE